MQLFGGMDSLGVSKSQPHCGQSLTSAQGLSSSMVCEAPPPHP